MSRDHTETCDRCGLERGGFDDAPCGCWPEATPTPGAALTGIAAAVRDVLAAAALGRLWVTRDSDPITGLPEAEVDVWSSRPVRHQTTTGDELLGTARSATWVTSDFDISGRVASIPLAAARACFATVPDDDRQCIVVG